MNLSGGSSSCTLGTISVHTSYFGRTVLSAISLHFSFRSEQRLPCAQLCFHFLKICTSIFLSFFSNHSGCSVDHSLQNRSQTLDRPRQVCLGSLNYPEQYGSSSLRHVWQVLVTLCCIVRRNQKQSLPFKLLNTTRSEQRRVKTLHYKRLHLTLTAIKVIMFNSRHGRETTGISGFGRSLHRR